MGYILSCCSTADLSEERMRDLNLNYLCFHFSVNGTSYPDDLGKTYPQERLYREMSGGAEAKTSQPNVDDYLDYFTPLLEQGHDVLHISFSSGLSGACNSANIARRELAERFPDRKLYVVDSLAASSGYGLLMERLAELRDSGMSLDDLYDWATANRLRMNHWFCSTDLTFFIKGGRISKSAGLFGTILKICPVLNVSYEGKLVPRKKLRGKQAALLSLVDHMVEHAEGGTAYSGKCFLSHSCCEEDARLVADEIERRFPQLDGKPELFDIGATVGTHTGPGTVALFFWGNPRVD